MANTKKIIKEIEDGIEQDSIKLAKKQEEILALESELFTNPSYAKFIKLKKSFDSQAELFKETATNEMRRLKKEFGIATIRGDFGTITYVEPKDKIVVVDEDEVPEEFKTLTPDLKAIGNSYEIDQILPPGVEFKSVKSYIKITPSKEK